jgi:hypothetical protein
MTRLLISVEGKSEWKFVEQVLQPHFANLEVYMWVKSGFLMIVPIYAKVSLYKPLNLQKKITNWAKIGFC